MNDNMDEWRKRQQCIIKKIKVKNGIRIIKELDGSLTVSNEPPNNKERVRLIPSQEKKKPGYLSIYERIGGEITCDSILDIEEDVIHETDGITTITTQRK